MECTRQPYWDDLLRKGARTLFCLLITVNDSKNLNLSARKQNKANLKAERRDDELRH